MTRKNGRVNLKRSFSGTLYLRGIPKELHKEFKSLCAMQHTSMTLKVIRMMGAELAKYGRVPSIK